MDSMIDLNCITKVSTVLYGRDSVHGQGTQVLLSATQRISGSVYLIDPCYIFNQPVIPEIIVNPRRQLLELQLNTCDVKVTCIVTIVL